MRISVRQFPYLSGAARRPNRALIISTAFVVALAAAAFLAGRTSEAADPTAGTLAPTSTQVAWRGTSPGGATPNVGVGSEDLCVEGVNCETFTLTIAGTPADWANAHKLVHVNLT